MRRTIIEVQRDLANSSGLGSDIIWDSLAANESHALKEKINALLPDNEKYQATVLKARENLFTNVWAQRKYTNRVLLSTIIYVMVTEETDLAKAKQSTNFTCHPVIRTRKCFNSNSSVGCCMVFIDEHSRVYQNWSLYLANNKLPSGTMIAPASGIYTLNSEDEVELEMHFTPARNSSLLKKTDTIVGVGGIMATAPVAASLLMPVAAPVVLAATAVSLAATAYCTARSAFQLNDRRKHGQSTSLKNSEARKNWLNLAGGVTGICAAGATKVLTSFASRGKEISMAAKVAVGGVNVSSILLSSTDLVTNVYDLYLKGNREICSDDLLKIASSLIVLTHSVNNLALISRIPKHQGSAKLRQALKMQARKTYSKIGKISRTGGNNVSKLELTRLFNNIPPKDVLKQNVLKFMMEAGRSVAVPPIANNIIREFIGVTEDGDVNTIQLLAVWGSNFVSSIMNPNNFIDVCETMAKFICEKSFFLLLTLTRTFVDNLIEVLNGMLKTCISTERVLFEMFIYCVKNYSDLTYELLERHQGEILIAIENFFYSLRPINDLDRTYSCKTCNGYYYECKL